MAEVQYKGANTWRSYVSALIAGDLLTAAYLYTTGIRYLTDRTRWAGHRLRTLYEEALVFTADAAADTISISDHMLADGTPVVLFNSGGALPAGLSTALLYYIRDADSDNGTAKLALTSGGAAVNITGAGTGTHSLYIAPRATAVTLTDATQTIQPIAKVLMAAAPAAARSFTPDDAGGAEGQEYTIVRPNTGANAITITRQTSGDSMAVLPSNTHTGVTLRYVGTKFRVVGLSVGATAGIDP